MFSIGDEVEAIKSGMPYFWAKASGIAVSKSQHGYLVQFNSGEYQKNRSKNSWFVAKSNLKLKGNE